MARKHRYIVNLNLEEVRFLLETIERLPLEQLKPNEKQTRERVRAYLLRAHDRLDPANASTTVLGYGTP